MSKQVLFDQEARNKILEGAEILYKAVSATIEKNVDAKKMFEKISKKYPEIKGILSNNPKWENSDNVFNQNKDLQNVMFQKNEANQIVGQADIKAGTILILSMFRATDTQIEKMIKEGEIEKNCK